VRRIGRCALSVAAAPSLRAGPSPAARCPKWSRYWFARFVIAGAPVRPLSDERKATAFGFTYAWVSKQLIADGGALRPRGPCDGSKLDRHGSDDQKIIVRHMMTAAAAMIAVASQPMNLKPSWT
jgi:hypothetical protein